MAPLVLPGDPTLAIFRPHGRHFAAPGRYPRHHAEKTCVLLASRCQKVRFSQGADSDYIQCAAALFRHRAISQEAGATERAPEADGTGRIALTPELQKGSLHNVFGSRPVTAVSEAF